MIPAERKCKFYFISFELILQFLSFSCSCSCSCSFHVLFRARLAAEAMPIVDQENDRADEENRRFINACELTSTNKEAILQRHLTTYRSRQTFLGTKPSLKSFLERFTIFLRCNESVKCLPLFFKFNFFFNASYSFFRSALISRKKLTFRTIALLKRGQHGKPALFAYFLPSHFKRRLMLLVYRPSCISIS